MIRSKQVVWLLMIAVIGLMVAAPLFAQDGDNAGEEIKGKSLMDHLKAGGAIGWVIVLLFVVTIALSIEHFVNIKRDKLCPPELVAELEALVEEGQYEEAVTLCNANPNFFCNTIGAALSKVGNGYEEMIKSMQETGEEEATKLNQKVSYLALLGNVGPMLGLLGTVSGMIGAFIVIENMAAPSPKMLAKGINEALVTTVEGLFVAIPALSVYFYFKNKITRLIIEIGMICGAFVDKFKQLPVESNEQS